MGDTQKAEGPAFSDTWLGRGVIVAAIAAAFCLGWLAATRGGAPTSPVSSATLASPTAPIRLDLDAGSLTLAPDAGLTLRPLPSLDPDALYRDSLDAGAPTPAPSPSAPAVP